MKLTLTAIAASITLATTAIAPIQANAAITTLGGCYDAVINWCNGAHPEHASECAGGGMDDCDEEFGNAVAGMGFDSIRVTPQADGTYKFRLSPTLNAAVVALERNHNDSEAGESRSAGGDPVRPTRRTLLTD
jgi:hypothetical protein